jgi:hypothetical protein
MKRYIFTLLIAAVGALTGVFFGTVLTDADLMFNIGVFFANLGVYYR